MKIETNEKFPCGYEKHTIAKVGLFDTGFVESKQDGQGCPLHGKDCKKGK